MTRYLSFLLLCVALLLASKPQLSFPRIYEPKSQAQRHFCTNLFVSSSANSSKEDLPFFLPNVTEDAAEQFCSILLNGSLTKKEIEDEVEKWAEQQGNEISESFELFKKVQTEKRAAIEAEIARYSEKLSNEASAINDEILGVLNEKQIKSSEEREIVARIFENAAPSVKGELYAMNAMISSKLRRGRPNQDLEDRRKQSWRHSVRGPTNLELRWYQYWQDMLNRFIGRRTGLCDGCPFRRYGMRCRHCKLGEHDISSLHSRIADPF